MKVIKQLTLLIILLELGLQGSLTDRASGHEHINKAGKALGLDQRQVAVLTDCATSYFGRLLMSPTYKTRQSLDLMMATARAFLDKEGEYIPIEDADVVLVETLSRVLLDIQTDWVKRKLEQEFIPEALVDIIYNENVYPDIIVPLDDNSEETFLSFGVAIENSKVFVHRAVVQSACTLFLSRYQQLDYSEQRRVALEAAEIKKKAGPQETYFFAAAGGRFLISRDSVSQIQSHGNKDPFDSSFPMIVQPVRDLLHFFTTRKNKVLKLSGDVQLQDLDEQDMYDCLSGDPFFVRYSVLKILEDHVSQIDGIDQGALLKARVQAKQTKKLYNLLLWFQAVTPNA